MLIFIFGLPLFVISVFAGPLDLHPHGVRNIEKKFEDISYRLPTNTKPLHYDIHLTTNLHLNESSQQPDPKWQFTGKVTIMLAPTETTRSITLHSRQQTINSIELKKDDVEIDLAQPLGAYNETLEFLTLTLAEDESDLTIDEKYTLIIEYNATLRDDNAGFYRSSYKNENGEDVWLGTTQFESTDARHAFPCYDEPGTRAPIKLTINHDKSLHAIANMPGDRNEIDEERVETMFEESVSMQTYLLAFVVSDFLYTGKVVGTLTPQRLFARPQAIKNFEGDFGLDSGIKILTDLEQYLNTHYSLPKLDQISIPDFASGAMENWGLVTYREELLLYNPETTSINSKHRIATIVSHELAHQFFGNLVSPDWWNYIWLNEGFATLYEYHTTNAVYPEFRSIDFMIRDAVQYSMVTDALDTTRAMTTDAQSPAQISSLFDDIAYEKSGSVLRMIQHAITDEAFSLGLHLYLEDRKFQAATSDDLAEGLRRGAQNKTTLPQGFTMKELVDNWSLNEGYPVVTVTRTEAGTLTLKQQRFVYNTQKQENNDQKWIIPITFATGKDSNFENTFPKFWLKEAEVTIPEGVLKLDNDDWVVLNVQETGYYRVHYESSLWRKIITKLNSASGWDAIHHINRAQLVDDVLNLARANLLEYETVFDLIRYLKNERDFLPWSSANAGLGYLNRLLLGTEPYEFFLRFVREIVTDVYNELGTTDGGLYEPLPTKLSRNIAIDWACLTGDESCLRETQQRVQDVIETPETNIEPDLQLTIFCNGLRKANQTQYEEILKRLRATSDQGSRTILISALGCITDTEIQEKYLQTSIETVNPIYRAQERNRVLQSVYLRGGITGLMSAIKFTNEKHVQIDEEYSSSASTSSPAKSAASAMAGRVTTEAAQTEYIKLLTTLVSANKMTAAERTGLTSTTQANLDWVSANGEAIHSYFKKLYNDATTPIVSTLMLVALVVLSLYRGQ